MHGNNSSNSCKSSVLQANNKYNNQFNKKYLNNVMSIINFKTLIPDMKVIIFAGLVSIIIFTSISSLRSHVGFVTELTISKFEQFILTWADGGILSELSSLNSTTASLCEIPADFPEGIQLTKEQYANWAGTISSEETLTAEARSPDDVVRIANWAMSRGYTLRPRGYKHVWSPVGLPQNKYQAKCAKVVLIDTTKYLTKMKMVSTNPTAAAVQVEAGTSLDDLVDMLEENGFGIASHPAVGDVSIGGILAISGHGSGLPVPGESYGSLSNIVISLNAVVWNNSSQNFEVRTFDRCEPETKVFLTNLGRMFITEVTLRVTPVFNLQCISRSDIHIEELFANPSTALPTSRTYARILNKSASVEVLWFPFTTKPWLKIWNIAPNKPASSEHVVTPYNYPLTDRFPKQLVDYFTEKMTTIWTTWTPFFTWICYHVSWASSSDLWGHSKNVLLYVKPSTLRAHGIGYAVIMNRQNIQLILSEFTTFYNNVILEYAEQGLYPANTPLHVRVTGLDDPSSVGVVNAEAPALSVFKPVPGRPDLDTALWISVLTMTGTSNLTNFMHKLEVFLTTNYPPSLAIVRPEWSKGWAYTESEAWENSDVLKSIPDKYRGEFSNDWDFAMSVFEKYDPLHVFTNYFLDKLFTAEPLSTPSPVFRNSTSKCFKSCNRVNKLRECSFTDAKQQCCVS